MGFEHGSDFLYHIAWAAFVPQVKVSQHLSVGLIGRLQLGFNIPWPNRRIRLVNAGDGQGLSLRSVDPVPHALKKRPIMRKYEHLCCHDPATLDSGDRAFSAKTVLAIERIFEDYNFTCLVWVAYELGQEKCQRECAFVPGAESVAKTGPIEWRGTVAELHRRIVDRNLIRRAGDAAGVTVRSVCDAETGVEIRQQFVN